MSIERILAPNPGPYTGPGTNTWIVSAAGSAAVIDPGPVINDHLLAILGALETVKPVAVFATHTHPDHAPLSNPLARHLEVPVYGYDSGPSFDPDIRLGDGDSIPIGTIELVAVHTPGHTRDHLCFQHAEGLFTGDHIMGGSTVIIEDAARYMDSLHKVARLGVARILPGHGPVMDDAPAVIEEYIAHRRMREEQILQALQAGSATVGDVVDTVYVGIDAALRPAATAQVVVQLRKLKDEGRVSFDSGRAESSTTVYLSEAGPE